MTAGSIGPLLFEPLLKHRGWGGTALLALGKRAPSDAEPPFGESWELADLPDSIAGGRTRIAAGPLAGLCLRQVIARHRDAIMGRAALTADGGFPLLIKFLDAAENLSVQVHPSPNFAAREPAALLKNEVWIILRAAPGAVVYRGIDPALTRAQCARLLDEDRILDALIQVPVQPGDCVQLPSGICHALGAGILAAEVQTPSDTTFRLWDWGRTDPGRPLHRSEALECLLVGEEQHLDRSAPASEGEVFEADGFRTSRLCRSEEFAIEQIELLRGPEPSEEDSASFLSVVTDGSPEVWIVLEGIVRLLPDPESRRPGTVDIGPSCANAVEARAFQTLLVPAACEGWLARLDPGTRFLRVTLPDRMSRMLAHDG